MSGKETCSFLHPLPLGPLKNPLWQAVPLLLLFPDHDYLSYSLTKLWRMNHLKLPQLMLHISVLIRTKLLLRPHFTITSPSRVITVSLINLLYHPLSPKATYIFCYIRAFIKYCTASGRHLPWDFDACIHTMFSLSSWVSH